MDANGDKFFDYVKTHNLRRSPKYDEDGERRFYVFNLVIGQFRIYGMTYNASNGSVMFPSWPQNGRRSRYASAPGVAVNRVREIVDRAIEALEEIEVEDSDESSDALPSAA